METTCAALIQQTTATSRTWARREARYCADRLPIARAAPDELNAALFKHWKAHMRVWFTCARARAFAGLALMLAMFPGLAGERAVAAEGLPKALDCTFEAGTSVAYAGGDYKASAANRLTFRIDAIDLEGQRAELQTEKGGKGELRVVRAVNANHFLEVVNEGFLNITTVYDLDPQRKAHPAVHSRHLGLLGEPIIAQYYGFCTEKR